MQKNNRQKEVPLSFTMVMSQLYSHYKKALENQQETEYLEELVLMITELEKKFNLNKKKGMRIPKKEELDLSTFKRLNMSESTVKTKLITEEKDTKSSKQKSGAIKTNLKLTSDQEKAFQELKRFIIDEDSKYFRLTGFAGTGKSYLIIELMNWLASEKVEFVAASPTNKASANLGKLARENGIKIDVTTIAKLLGQQPTINQESGQQVFLASESVSLDRYEVIILDEFSMISQGNFNEIIKAVSYSNTKIIFVGDAAQLPPVGEKQPIVETTELIEHSANLSQIVRFEGEIGRIAAGIRTNHESVRQFYSICTTTDQSITCLNRSDWLKQATEYFRSAKFRSNSDHCRILVWRNKTADSLNDWLRKQLWGENALPFVEGDRLIAKKPVFRLINNTGNKKKDDWRIVMNNSDECEVVDQPKLKQQASFSFWQVPVITDDGNELMLKILTPESEKLRQEKLEQLRKEKRWPELLNLDKSYDYCPFAYALTTHKAQGSSIEYVFLDLQDMRGCTDLQKILYTALTRAKIRAYISR